MSNLRRLGALIALIGWAAWSGDALASAPVRVAADRVPHQVVVRYAPHTTPAERAAARRAVQARVGRRLALPRSELLLLPRTMSVPAAVRVLDRVRAVDYAEANALATPASVCPGTLVDGARCLPNDPRFREQYDLDNTRQVVAGSAAGVLDADVDAVEAWNVTRGSSGVVVAVVDSGIAYDNPDLAPNLWTNAGEQGTDSSGRDKRDNDVDDDRNGHVDDWRGWDVVGRSVANPSDADNDPIDISGHGTHVAGTIGARANNGIGVAGLNWNVRIMNVRVRAERSNESAADIADGFAYAARNGARVVNVSLSGRYFSQYLQDTIAAYPNVLFVVAAGNDGLELDAADNDRWPCEYPGANLVCVGATGRSDELASWSNRGARSVDLAAPGMILIGSQPAYTRLAIDTFDTDPFAAPRWTAGPDGVRSDWGLSSTKRRSGTSLTNRATGTAANPSNTWVETVAPYDLRNRRGCELRATVWVDNPDALSGLYWQARADRNFMAPSRTPAQDTPTPNNDTITFMNDNRQRSSPRINISDLDGERTVYVRMGVLQSSSATQTQVWVDDLTVSCMSDAYSANGAAETAHMAGTSMATPHVAGAAALMLAQDPTRTVAALRSGLLRAVDPLPSLAGRTVTGGRLNVYKALAASTVAVRDGVLRVDAGDGTTNRFTLTRQDAAIRVRDPWTPLGTAPMAGSRLVPGAGCSAVSDTEVSCPASAITEASVQTGDLDDTVDGAGAGVPVRVDEAAAAVPAVTTGQASAVTASGATLSGTVNPEGQATTTHFQWGTDQTYGRSTPSQSLGGDRADHLVSAALSGLQPATTYHYRLVATNASGTVRGADRTFTTAAATGGGTYADAVLADAPVGYWRLGEGTGTLAADQRAANPGAYTGAHTLGAAGAVAGDTAVRLTGGSVSVPDAPALRTADTFSLEAWVKLHRLGAVQGIATKGATYMVYLDSANRLVLRKPNTGVIATATRAITDTTRFHHIMVTKAGPTVRLYLDGADVTGTVVNRTLVAATAPLTLGAGARALDGTLDEVALYDRALPASAVATHHSSAGGTSSVPSAPAASTGAASGVSASSATVNGTVNPRGQATTAAFEWGTTTAYGQATPARSVGSDRTDHPVSAVLSGLTPGTTYHYRLVATNATGTTRGADGTFTTPASSGGSYAQTVLADAPVSYWRLGEASGTTAADARGGNPGTYRGTFDLAVPGAVSGDGAVRFAGTGTVRVPDSASLRTADTFSLEAWVRLGRLGLTQGIASKGATYAVYVDSANRIVLRKPNSGTVAVSTRGIADTTRFHHVVVTKAGATVRLYLDGADVTGAVTNRTLAATTGALTMAGGAGPLHGALDEVAVYDRSLGAATVAAHRTAAG